MSRNAPVRTRERGRSRVRGGARTALRAAASGAVRLAYALGLPAALLALWWALTARGGSFYYPPLGDIAAAFTDTWLTGGRLARDVAPSLARLAAGWAGAVLLGVGLGLLLGLRPRLRALAEPLLAFCRAVPPPVLIPVLMLVAGIGNGMKVAVIVTGAVWPVLLNTIQGVRSLDEVLSDTARCYGVTGAARLRRLVLPAAAPAIVTGMRQALSLAIILMVIGEMFASSSGLGFAIVQFQRGFAIPEMWSGIFLLGLVGFGLSLLFGLFEARALGWYHGQRGLARGAGGARRAARPRERAGGDTRAGDAGTASARDEE
ncbi:ABC transporter permease [Streptomyces marincola]|uniref:ABC transporter permease n=1 Tax=Streptomyces marincola TaxID=2878388 RepID=UPI001CF52D38|nr:ABC transporter permease subunit [Streptomyces marincola]UCM87718.1 ABC transporter permease subunit [Streptomyces marincola]